MRMNTKTKTNVTIVYVIFCNMIKVIYLIQDYSFGTCSDKFPSTHLSLSLKSNPVKKSVYDVRLKEQNEFAFYYDCAAMNKVLLEA